MIVPIFCRYVTLSILRWRSARHLYASANRLGLPPLLIQLPAQASLPSTSIFFATFFASFVSSECVVKQNRTRRNVSIRYDWILLQSFILWIFSTDTSERFRVPDPLFKTFEVLDLKIPGTEDNSTKVFQPSHSAHWPTHLLWKVSQSVQTNCFLATTRLIIPCAEIVCVPRKAIHTE